ncbi:Disorganized muscle protein [Dirofilaria immitis]
MRLIEANTPTPSEATDTLHFSTSFSDPYKKDYIEMAPPVIHGEPKIIQDIKTNSVRLEVIVSGSLPDKTRWFLGEKEIEPTETYQFSHHDEGGKKILLRCEIKNFDKELAGSYKAKFYSNDGENSATFTVKAGNAPEFHDKPHIVQRDGGNIIVIKVRAKSHLEMTAEWFKDDKPLKTTDRIKILTKQDDKDKDGFQFLLEIHGPVKEDQAKYKCVVKNAEGQNEQSLNLCFD